MFGTKRRLRMTPRGLRTVGDWETEPLAALRDACRASIAVEKLIGESILKARDAGHSWQEIGRALGVNENASDWNEVAQDLATSRRHVWDRYINSRDN